MCPKSPYITPVVALRPSRHLSSSELQVFGEVDMRLCLLLVAGATTLPRPQGGDQIRCFVRPKQVYLSGSNQDHIVVLCLSLIKTRLLKERNFSQERMGGRRGLGQRKPGKQLDLKRGTLKMALAWQAPRRQVTRRHGGRGSIVRGEAAGAQDGHEHGGRTGYGFTRDSLEDIRAPSSRLTRGGLQSDDGQSQVSILLSYPYFSRTV